jgi:hypothetical protein
MLTPEESRIIDVAIRHLAYSWDHEFTTALGADGHIHARDCGMDVSDEGKRSAIAALHVFREFHKDDSGMCAGIDAALGRMEGV